MADKKESIDESRDPLQVRKAYYPIEELILKRWSPRAMSGEKLKKQELLTLFEAARWAPSTYNEQEWRYLYAERGSEHWKAFFSALADANQAWCDRASHLLVVCSRTTFSRNGKPNPVHTFDAGASFQNLCLQAASMGLVAHGMAGFDQDKIRQSLEIPEEFSVEAMVALGRPGDPEELPEELQARDVPSDRKPIEQIAREGMFSFDS